MKFRAHLRFLAAALLGFSIAPHSAAAPGDLDTTFGSTTGGPNGVVYGAAVQPDGKLVIGGVFTTVDGTARNNIARLETDGTLDTTFGTTTGGPDGTVFGVAIQPDGKIVIVGEFTTVDGTTRRRVARLKPDGTLDAGFVSTVGSADVDVSCAAILEDGKILIAGNFSTVGGTARNSVARLHADGTLDTTFGSTTSGPDAVNCAAVQSDGKIVIAGSFTVVDGVARSSVARLNADGTLDTTFGSTTGGPDGPTNFVAIQPDGKTIIGGAFANVDGTARSRIARLDTNGLLDTTFSSTTGGTDSSVYGGILQSDGKILICGFFDAVDGISRSAVARLKTDGTLDTSFGSTTGGPDGSQYGAVLQGDGKTVSVGFFFNVDGVARDHAARLENGSATGSLTVPALSEAKWLRGGTAPEASRVTFEYSTDGGTTWIPLGEGSRISGGWQINGVSIPALANVRARAFTPGGIYNGSSGFVEATATAPSGAGGGGSGGGGGGPVNTWSYYHNLALTTYQYYAYFGLYDYATAFYYYYYGIGDSYFYAAYKNQALADFSYYNGFALYFLYLYGTAGYSSYYYYLAFAYYYYFVGVGDFNSANLYYNAYIAAAFGG